MNPSTTEISTLSLHDALPIFHLDEAGQGAAAGGERAAAQLGAEEPRRLVGAESELTLQLQSRDAIRVGGHQIRRRSEEHTSELQSRFDLVCRLLLEKKKQPCG